MLSSYLFPLNILFPLNKNLVILLIIKHIINSYFYERFYAKCIFFFKNICTISVFVVTLQAKNLEHKFERKTILEYEKVIYNSFTDAIIS